MKKTLVLFTLILVLALVFVSCRGSEDTDEEMQQYNELLATLTENQHTTLDLYNQFEDLSIKYHDVYYS